MPADRTSPKSKGSPYARPSPKSLTFSRSSSRAASPRSRAGTPSRSRSGTPARSRAGTPTRSRSLAGSPTTVTPSALATPPASSSPLFTPHSAAKSAAASSPVAVFTPCKWTNTPAPAQTPTPRPTPPKQSSPSSPTPQSPSPVRTPRATLSPGHEVHALHLSSVGLVSEEHMLMTEPEVHHDKDACRGDPDFAFLADNEYAVAVDEAYTAFKQAKDAYKAYLATQSGEAETDEQAYERIKLRAIATHLLLQYNVALAAARADYDAKQFLHHDFGKVHTLHGIETVRKSDLGAYGEWLQPCDERSRKVLEAVTGRDVPLVPEDEIPAWVKVSFEVGKRREQRAAARLRETRQREWKEQMDRQRERKYAPYPRKRARDEQIEVELAPSTPSPVRSARSVRNPSARSVSGSKRKLAAVDDSAPPAQRRLLTDSPAQPSPSKRRRLIEIGFDAVSFVLAPFCG